MGRGISVEEQSYVKNIVRACTHAIKESVFREYLNIQKAEYTLKSILLGVTKSERTDYYI